MWLGLARVVQDSCLVSDSKHNGQLANTSKRMSQFCRQLQAINGHFFWKSLSLEETITL